MGFNGKLAFGRRQRIINRCGKRHGLFSATGRSTERTAAVNQLRPLARLYAARPGTIAPRATAYTVHLPAALISMQFKLNIFTAYLRNHYFLLWMKAAAEIKPQPELKPPAKLTFPDVINGVIVPQLPEEAPPPWEWHGENRFPYEDEAEQKEEKKKKIAPPPLSPMETGELNKNYFNKFCISRRQYKSRGATVKRKKHKRRLYPPDLNMEGKLPEKPEHYTKQWRVERYLLIADIAKRIRGEI